MNIFTKIYEYFFGCLHDWEYIETESTISIYMDAKAGLPEEGEPTIYRNGVCLKCGLRSDKLNQKKEELQQRISQKNTRTQRAIELFYKE